MKIKVNDNTKLKERKKMFVEMGNILDNGLLVKNQQWLELYIATKKFMSSKIEKIATGIFVNFYSEDIQKDPYISWKTEDYQCEQDWGGCSDGN